MPARSSRRLAFTCRLLLTAAGVWCVAAGPAARQAHAQAQRSAVYSDEPASSGVGNWFRRVVGREEPQAPPEPSIFENVERVRPKQLTVPADTVTALKLMAQDWVLAAREKGPKVRERGNGTFVKEYSTFDDKYTIEIERADEDDDATLIGYVFLNSVHMRGRVLPTHAAAAATTTYNEEQRRIRMVFRLLERWEFSEIAEEFVFNRQWELARVQYKPRVPAAPRARPPAPDVSPPQGTPSQ